MNAVTPIQGEKLNSFLIGYQKIQSKLIRDAILEHKFKHRVVKIESWEQIERADLKYGAFTRIMDEKYEQLRVLYQIFNKNLFKMQ